MTARANHAMGMAALVQNRNDEAFDWLRQLAAGDGRAAHYREALFGLIDLAEAGRRTGRQPEASRLVAGVLAGTQGELSARLLQVRALCRALLADGSAAEEHFLTALSVTEGDHVPFERARVRLSYGQWLRRERRHKDARPHLNAAAHVFRLLAAAPWLEAAIHEQRAAGEEPAPHRRMGWRACHPRNGKSSCSRPEVSLILKSPRGCSSPRERSAPICTGLLPSSAYPIARSSPPSPQPCRA